MARILKCAVILLLAGTTMVNFRVFVRAMSSVAKSFKAHGVVPDVIPKAPAALAAVKYPSGGEAEEGNELTPSETMDVPSVTWNASPSKFYTIAMIDPDAPTRKDPKFREWQHWLVGNIPGGDVPAGEILSEYVGCGPSANTGLHRYVILVYEQPARLTFDQPHLSNKSGNNRTFFSIAKFADKHKMGHPVAGNFYQTKYDDYVPLLYKQLGL